MNYPEPGKKYKHYKGGLYEVLFLSKHTETDEVLVNYKSLHFGSYYSRPLDSWNDKVEMKGIITNTSRFDGYLLTFTNKTLFLIKDIHFIDTNICKNAVRNGGKCFKTTKNVAYHLTWDLYFEGNPYYENKKNNLVEIWSRSDEDFKYNKIIT